MTRGAAEAIDLALAEDGNDLTSRALFSPEVQLHAALLAKEHTLVAGLPLMPLILDRCAAMASDSACDAFPGSITCTVAEGARVAPGTIVAEMIGPARLLLKAERVVLNFICHLSGIANLTARYVAALQGTRTRLLDTRKTLPGLRYPEKYAVLLGGGVNHRKNLEEMLMLKDNHIDQAGSITAAVTAVRRSCSPCPPLEVECRTLAEVDEAAACGVDRIMLDNMTPQTMIAALARIPAGIESEISGGVDLETIAAAGRFGPDYISVGRITHSAPAADFSMVIASPGTRRAPETSFSGHAPDATGNDA